MILLRQYCPDLSDGFDLQGKQESESHICKGINIIRVVGKGDIQKNSISLFDKVLANID